MTRQDVAVLGAFLVMQVLMAPVQHHVFESSCLGQRASEEDDENELRARRFATLADGPLYRNRWFLYPRVLIMLAIAATAYLRRRLPDQRKRVLLANFATTWVCHLVVNLRMLYLGMQQPVLSPAMIACQACLGLSCHLMLPLNPRRRRDRPPIEPAEPIEPSDSAASVSARSDSARRRWAGGPPSGGIRDLPDI